MKWLDLPPVWLLGALGITWGLAQIAPGFTIGFPFQGLIATVLTGLGVGLMGLAVWEMTRAKTTFVPRQDPNALVTSGIFHWTRNPIYLGDWLVLLAGILWWGVWLALPLLWLFPTLIVRRFIAGEEAKMRHYFGADFDRWAETTGRWI